MPNLAPQRLIILDRDGVINEDSDAYIKSMEEWRPYPQAIAAMARLFQAGWTISVATNQSGIARGYYDEAVLASMHEHLHRLVEEAGGKISHIAYCPHGPGDSCDCRKPKAGLLEQIQQALCLDTLEGAWMVGDSLRDLQAGIKKGCHPILVRTGKGANTEAMQEYTRLLPSPLAFDDLDSFSHYLLDHA